MTTNTKTIIYDHLHSLLIVVSFLLLGLCSCSSDRTQPSGPFPSSIIFTSGDTLRLGEILPGTERVLAFENLHPSTGAAKVFVERDSLGRAWNFEFWYGTDAKFPDVLRFYTERLGPPGRTFERLVGECAEWEKGDYSFLLCKSREPGEHGEVIATIWFVD